MYVHTVLLLYKPPYCRYTALLSVFSCMAWPWPRVGEFQTLELSSYLQVIAVAFESV
jgi:hypothetical protein